MNSVEFFENVWSKLPADTKARIEKLAASEKKTLADEVVFLLRQGVNTLAPFILGFGC